MSEPTGKRTDVSLPKTPPTRVRQPARWAIPIALLAAGGLGFALLSREPAKPKLPPANPQPIRTKVVKLHAKDYRVVIKAHGVVRPHNESVLSALVSGRVARFGEGFEDGAFFEEGDVLVELESDDYRNAVTMAEAKSLGAKAAQQLAAVNHRRNAELLKEKLLTQIEFDRTATGLLQTTAEADSAAAQLERARRDLDRTQIRAPFAGCMRKRTVGLGHLVGPGTALGTVFAVDWAEVRLPIAARELPFLDLAEGVERTFEFPKDPTYASARKLPKAVSAPTPQVLFRDTTDTASNRSWSGHVIRAEGALDPDSLDLFVIARVDDPFGRTTDHAPLRPGQPVVGFIQGRVLTNVVAVPRAAFRELDRVLLVDPNKLTLSSRRVLPIWSDETHVIVSADVISDQALVATTHLVYAPEGAKVEIIPDIPAPAASGTNAQVSTTGKLASP